MRKMYLLFSAVLTASIFNLGLNSGVLAQESQKGHSHARAEIHGGTVVMSKMHHFEVVFKPKAIKVYLYDGRQNPLSAEGVTGTVTLKTRGGEPKTVPLKVVSMHDKGEKGMMKHEEMEHEHGDKGMKHEKAEHMNEEKEHAGKMSMSMSFLKAEVDLSEVEPGSMKAVFSLKGLPNEKETEATFTETFKGFAKMKKMHHEKSETEAHKH